MKKRFKIKTMVSDRYQIRKDGRGSRSVPKGYDFSHETSVFWVYSRPTPVIEIVPRRTRSESMEDVKIAARILSDMKLTQDPLS